MFELDAFIIRGHEKVIRHLRDSASSETERHQLQKRIDQESGALDRYLRRRLGRAQRAA
jgi:hypothetical protein